MFECHICSESLRLKALYSNGYSAMAHSKISTVYTFIGCTEQCRVAQHSMSRIRANFDGFSQPSYTVYI